MTGASRCEFYSLLASSFQYGLENLLTCLPYSWSNKVKSAELRTRHARVASNNGWRNTGVGDEI